MSIVGFRIDDRLLHGQVVENWIQWLRPDLIVVASERASADPLTHDLYAAAMPPGVDVDVVPLARAVEAATRPPGRVLLIVESPADALALIEGGLRPLAITVGGLHHDTGKERLLDFVYLNEDDRDALRHLLALGYEVIAQDVPRHRPNDLGPLLAGAASK